jgi:hypothetical protein
MHYIYIFFIKVFMYAYVYMYIYVCMYIGAPGADEFRPPEFRPPQNLGLGRRGERWSLLLVYGTLFTNIWVSFIYVNGPGRRRERWHAPAPPPLFICD